MGRACVKKMAAASGTVTTDEVETAISDSLREIGIERIKDKQKEAILAFISGRDTFVVLPTGYGKSSIYAVLPLVFDKLKGS